MLQCPSCAESLVDSIRVCPACGTSVDSYVTLSGTPPRRASPTPSSGSGSRRDTPDGRFVSGTVFADRYRIVGRVGRGGMGEVYRADDLRLGQPVALKFLPERLQDDPDRQERLFGEVRLARQVSHPVVCRVYDVGEAQGQPFLSMEFIDGEDLASLLRRIGRLPRDKALEIARQLCAGLAAAHERGVLHRDLKPENVMLDGRGKVRITDFGLAGLAETLRGGDVRSGTPAYMAPEQLAGREATVRSDVYALGLVFYELFTGRRTFGGKSAVELTRQHQEEDPVRPSTLVDDIDPAVERAILRCLEKDPRLRPASALAVAASLPGGDPLAAALAAGETPSPELVAAAGEAEGLSPAVAGACLVGATIAIVLFVLLARPMALFRQVPIEKSPDALEDRARELVRDLGYTEPPADTRVGFAADADYLQHVTEHDTSPRRWEVLAGGQPPAMLFWYRQSPRPLVSTQMSGRVSATIPPAIESGMAGARFDLQGRLRHLYVVPPQVETPLARAAEPDWAPLFSQARLDPALFKPATPTWTPPFYCDARAAWEGAYPERPDVPIRVEAAAYRGRPVFFQIVAPWTRPAGMQAAPPTAGKRAAGIIGSGVLILLLLSSVLLAKRNLLAGRGDRTGAVRLAAYTVASGMAAWLLYADHVADLSSEGMLYGRALGGILVLALLVWVLYLAIEPYVRRLWPHTLISWARLLRGRIGDGRVGGDILIGVATGAAAALLLALCYRLVPLAGLPAMRPSLYGLETLLGIREAAAHMILGEVDAATLGMALLLMILLLRLVMPQWLAVLLVLLINSVPNALGSDVPLPVGVLINVVTLAVPTVVLLRFGLLAAIANIFVLNQLISQPLTPDLGSWTGRPTIVVVLMLAALLVFGFQSATRRRWAPLAAAR